MRLSFRSVAVALSFVAAFSGSILIAQPVSTTAASSPRAALGPIRPDRFPQTREVPAEEYRRAVAEFTQAFAAAEEARQRLIVLRPDDGKPDPIDCYFHPWHPGCQDLWTTLERERGFEWSAAVRQNFSASVDSSEEQGSEEPAKMNPWVAGAIEWAVSKALDHVWDVGVCLYKADGPDGRGLEGSDGMKKFGDCVVKPKGNSISGSRAAWGRQGLDATASPMSDSFASTDAVQLSGNWTQWLNRDTPGGSGDYETLQEFLKAGQACPQPLSIECQTADGLGWQEAGQTYSCTTAGGGLCRNDAQPAGSRCRDYRVRFLCP